MGAAATHERGLGSALFALRNAGGRRREAHVAGGAGDVDAPVVDDVADRVEESDLESSRDLEDEMDDTPTSPSTGGKSNQFAVTLNFLNTIVGAGIVGLPYVFRIAGFYMVRVFSNSFIISSSETTTHVFTGYYSTLSR